ncbi:MAG: phenylalanine--tRNA ligase subunit beta [Pseudomarimonas sp.]
MKFPESWLREHVEVTASRDELAAALTAIGLEVEALEVIGAQLGGVVVGEIIAAVRHPEADRLQVCQVDIGNGESLQIVCGAPNARVGLKAPLAMIGASLPGGLQIGAAKLRGVASSGMLCSAKELGIDADASGLFELPTDARVGSPVGEMLALPDARFELKLTPNRADCFSVRGIAFDVAAALGSTVKPLAIAAAATQVSSGIAINLAATSDCPLYVGRVVEGVNATAPTPLWLSERLRRSGVRPISLLVDITQYVMLELGQPMHAFDADLLIGPIGVRRAQPGETLTLLDSREVTLDGEFLVITDADRAVALAGVMGGLDTRVTSTTQRVFLEAAHFAPDAVIGRARKLGMHTDAAHRFERGVDPALPAIAIERATQLIVELAGGRPGPTTTANAGQGIIAPKPVALRRQRLARVLGVQVGDGEVSRILTALGMGVSDNAEGWLVTPPSSRFDIAIEEDLIEEVARIHGYDKIPLTAPTGEIRLPAIPEQHIDAGLHRQQLTARGFFEAINFAFLDQRVLAAWKLDAHAVVLANPLSNELGVMRTALAPGLVEALRRNLARQQSRVRLFELGRVFGAASGAPIETARIAAVATGNAQCEQWSAGRRDVDFFDLKGDLQSLRGLAGVDDLSFVSAAELDWLHPGRSAIVQLAGESIGWVGHLHPRLLKALDIDRDVVAFELDLEPLSARAIAKASELSRFPSVRRDLALVVAENTPWSQLEVCLRNALGSRLQQLVVFDRYVGPGLESACKSLAIGLILQDVSRTLTDEDADVSVAAALEALSRECGARLRS